MEAQLLNNKYLVYSRIQWQKV